MVWLMQSDQEDSPQLRIVQRSPSGVFGRENFLVGFFITRLPLGTDCRRAFKKKKRIRKRTKLQDFAAATLIMKL